MANILYITCNLKPREQSRSLTIGNEFLKRYSERHPEDRIDFLDLYRDPIQRIDTDVLNGWGKLRTGASFDLLSEDEVRKIGRIGALADQFVATDKYVFVTPMWNLGFPAELKMYIDTVCVVGKTFTYTESGAVGLLRGMGKKCLHIHSCGGFHCGSADDHSVPYLKSVMNFMGIEDFRSVVVEGMDALPHRAEEFMDKALAESREAAALF
ncbi:FMN-dependent NADH-azoreductase [Trichlorobacter lovleyi]|uniref:FMN-dependent NADH:quinone oxidoreductase n=1 Tax=Trichlorobacter lovleyi (strain ATCC BAA-1151 / DSM 17278 / SZ) TaxID=398767 RepID=AZOR_TRIL1|nr:FMN-dependent NADH-azoreductase [Trichlorobacter lovleyi]B3E8C4.1 RecName: Full=FMN-dependent NADH:quinone oxidoreductase; AltName: Full=Azo-dye reductase; AltName: Full=FMN-dependent NADH-azo compound oxidoreductase; AltName: Full=FMN-dependent NADH-azoreductase [Trichlorobacter lovleyi SZ]ACD95161.1 NAD(P)H dehydrogenase (quinone) [Trichlorobacter lovleyi SZ]